MAVAPDVDPPGRERRRGRRAARLRRSRWRCWPRPRSATTSGPASLDATRERFPDLWMPSRSDLCFATTNRQAALKEIAARCDAVVVIGSANSSNTRALEKVARDAGLPPGAAGQRRRRAPRRPDGHGRGHRRRVGPRGAGRGRGRPPGAPPTASRRCTSPTRTSTSPPRASCATCWPPSTPAPRSPSAVRSATGRRSTTAWCTPATCSPPSADARSEFRAVEPRVASDARLGAPVWESATRPANTIFNPTSSTPPAAVPSGPPAPSPTTCRSPRGRPRPPRRQSPIRRHEGPWSPRGSGSCEGGRDGCPGSARRVRTPSEQTRRALRGELVALPPWEGSRLIRDTSPGCPDGFCIPACSGLRWGPLLLTAECGRYHGCGKGPSVTSWVRVYPQLSGPAAEISQSPPGRYPDRISDPTWNPHRWFRFPTASWLSCSN